MKGFILSFRSEFYKSRKTAGFWSPIILPPLLCLLPFFIFFHNSERFAVLTGMVLWTNFSNIILAVTGSLLLPMLIVFVAYSVNSIEHKADTWKTLFSLPLSKLSVYAAKYFYALFLIFLCLLLFVLFILGFGSLLSILKPQLKFSDYNMAGTLVQLYFKLFLSSLGILSIQFLLSLLFRDFIKPMGIGFVSVITGIILATAGWQYAFWFPYSHPMLTMIAASPPRRKGPMQPMVIDLFTHEIYVSLAVASVVFVAGYFIVLKKSVK